MQCLRLSTQDAIAAEPSEKVISEGSGSLAEVRSQQYRHRKLFEVKVADQSHSGDKRVQIGLKEFRSCSISRTLQ